MKVGEAFPHIGLSPDDELHIAIVYEKDGEGFHAYTPGLKGVHADGATAEEAIGRAKQCVEVYLESMNKHHEKLVETEGLVILKTPPTKIKTAKTQWHSINQPGINLKTPQLVG